MRFATFVAFFAILFALVSPALAHDVGGDYLDQAITGVSQALPGCTADGSLPVPPGVIMSWEPAGSQGQPNYAMIQQVFYGCVAPEISGIPNPKAVFQTDTGIPGEIGTLTATGPVVCLPKGTYYVFLAQPDVWVSGRIYSTPQSWQAVRSVLFNGAIWKFLNTNVAGVLNYSEQTGTCSPNHYSTASATALHLDGIPLIRFDPATGCQ